jgi:S1-C subfamily serine protease/Tfp pilus assembly protein PilF
LPNFLLAAVDSSWATQGVLVSVLNRIAFGAALSVPLAAVISWGMFAARPNKADVATASTIARSTESMATTRPTPVQSAIASPASNGAVVNPTTAPSLSLQTPSTRPAELAADVLFAQSSPAVVRVISRTAQLETMQGTGFFISADGVLVTNYHVIRGGDFANIVLDDNSTVFVQGIIAQDPKADLAILKLDLASGQYLQLNDQPIPRIGTKVYAIGNPDGLTNTLSEGLISGIRNRSNGLASIQTTAPISHGSSGGPLLAADGLVVGVTSASMTNGQNLNFAVPASQISVLLRQKQPFQKLASAGVPPMGADDGKIFAAAMASAAIHDYNAALTQLETLRETQKSNPLFWISVGLVQGQLRQEKQCIAALKQAQQLDPTSESASYFMAAAYLSFKDFPQAVAAAQSAVQAKPTDGRAHGLLGWGYLGQRRFEKAHQAFWQAIQYAPDRPDIYNGMCLVYASEQRWADGITMARKSIALKPDYADAYDSLGIAYAGASRFDEARLAWQTAMRIDPKGIAGRFAVQLTKKLNEELRQQAAAISPAAR